jgi:WD40 repeat protein
MSSEEILIPLAEGLSSVHFCPFHLSLLSTSSWSGSVRGYGTDTLSEISHFPFPSPILSSAWLSSDLVAADSTEGPIFLSDGRSLLAHSDDVTSISVISSSESIISSSWDKTLRIWDFSFSDAPYSLSFPEKLLLSEICVDFTVITHGHRKSVFIVDLRNLSLFKRRVSSLGRHIRSACASRPVPFGWAIGAIDSRIVIEYFGNLR